MPSGVYERKPRGPSRAMSSAQYHQRHVAKMKREGRYQDYVKRGNDRYYLGRLMNRYGVKPSLLFALYDQQGGRCRLCRAYMTLSRVRRNAPRTTAHVDHDHTTGVVRGLLCGACNRGLGQMHESVATLRTAAAYLEAARCVS
jgi:hypothetical protein